MDAIDRNPQDRNFMITLLTIVFVLLLCLAAFAESASSIPNKDPESQENNMMSDKSLNMFIIIFYISLKDANLIRDGMQ